jgi:hypothetical protein
MTDKNFVRPKERDAIIQSLRAGVVPKRGLHHIQVGRSHEVKAVLDDIIRITEGGSFIRFVIGEFGSGKTFFLNLIRLISMEKKCVTLHADLSPDRRLFATGGQARMLYAEMMRNLSTRSKPDGGALNGVVERFITQVLKESKETGIQPNKIIHKKLNELTEMVCGYDFAEVIAAYWDGHNNGNDELKSAAVRWLRGEYSTKTDSKKDLGVRTIIDDSNIYDMLKLFAKFVRLAGFSGLIICFDEMVNLYKLLNTQARHSNYEVILHVLNDTLQGISNNIGFIMGGTPEFLYDTRKGLYSYPALQSRLAENTFASNGLIDLSGPIIQLENLSPEDLYILLTKLRYVFSFGKSNAYTVPDEGLRAFMEHCSKKIGNAYFRTPRNSIVAFINLLAVLEQNPNVSWKTLLKDIDVTEEKNTDLEPIVSENQENEINNSQSQKEECDNSDDDLTSFKL